VAVKLAEIVGTLDRFDERAMEADMCQLLRHRHSVAGQTVRSVVIGEVLVNVDKEFTRTHVPQNHAQDLVVGLKLGPDVQRDALSLFNKQLYVNGDEDVWPEMLGELVCRQAFQLGDGIGPHPVFSRHARSSLVESRCP
jgi:hypothetical protein